MFSSRNVNFSDEDDDDEFGINIKSSTSNLSNIFGISMKPSPSDNSTLKYVPEKQVKPVENKSNKQSEWEIAIAKIVTAFKLLDNKNVSQGKMGVALLKNSEGSHRLILYRTKTNVLSTLNIHKDTVIYINNPYLQYSDDLEFVWSILFEKNDFLEILEGLRDTVIIQNCSKRINDIKQNTGSVNNNNVPEMQKNEQSSSRGFEEISSDEQLKETKATILSRMAKMGQALPNIPVAAKIDLSDSSDTEAGKQITTKQPIISRKPKIQQTLVPVNTCNPSSQIIAQNVHGIVPYNHSATIQDTQYVNMLMTENRTQNTEIRINVSKLETKVDQILNKIDNFSWSSNRSNNVRDVEDEILKQEEQILHLKKENRNLKVQLKNKENNLVQKKQNGNEYHPEEFEYLKSSIYIDPALCSTSADLIKLIASKYELILQQLDTSNNSLSVLQSQSEQSMIDKIQTINSLKEEIDILKSDITNLQLQTKLDIENCIKTIMNNLYQMLVQHFQEKDVFTYNELLKICGNTIKLVTNDVIDRTK